MAAANTLRADLTPASMEAIVQYLIDNEEGFAKAWINFNGTGTIAIRDSFNVSGIIDNGTGDYTVTWDTDFADTNYAFTTFARDTNDSAEAVMVAAPFISDTKAVGSLQIKCQFINTSAAGVFDCPEVNVHAFGAQ